MAEIRHLHFADKVPIKEIARRLRVARYVSFPLYLFTGAIFPLDVLPVWLRPIGYIFPVTYWLEISRRALLGTTAEAFKTFAAYSNMELMGILTIFTAVLVVASAAYFRWRLDVAREKGLIDMESSY